MLECTCGRSVPCFCMLHSMVAPYLGISHFLFWSGLPQHADLLGFCFLPSRGMPDCKCGSKTMFLHAAQHGCAVSRTQSFRFWSASPQHADFFAVRVKEHRSASVVARSCSSLLCDTATPYPPIGHVLFWSASPLHVDFSNWFCFSFSRDAGVREQHQDHVSGCFATLLHRIRGSTISSTDSQHNNTPTRGFLLFRVEGYQSASVTSRPCLRLLCDTVASYLPSIISFSGLHHHYTQIFLTGFVFPSRGVLECERGNKTMSQPASQHGCTVYWLESFPFGCSALRILCWGFLFFRVERYRSVSAADMPCFRMLRSMVAPYLGLNYFLFATARRFLLGFLFSKSRNAGV
jgi:hypothetical protein